MVYGNYLDEVLLVAGYYNYYYAHDHLYSPVALLSFSGGILERYEYDAYGRRNVFENDFDARSGSYYGLPIAFTGQRLDVLNGEDLEVMYYKNRCYDVEMGRFLTRDPIDYDGDSMNLYQYVHSSPMYTTDPLGLIDKADLGTSLYYTCNCGWVDTFHSSEDVANDFINRIKDPKKYFDQDRPTTPIISPFGAVATPEPNPNGDAYVSPYSKDRFKICFRMGHGVGVVSCYAIRYDTTQAERESIALGILMETSINYENLQGNPIARLITESSYSIEDLPSNLLAFYAALKGYDKHEILKHCKQPDDGTGKFKWTDENGKKNPNFDLSEYKNFFGSLFDATNAGTQKNHNFAPQYNNCSLCGNQTPQWPSIFDGITNPMYPSKGESDTSKYYRLNKGRQDNMDYHHPPRWKTPKTQAPTKKGGGNVPPIIDLNGPLMTDPF